MSESRSINDGSVTTFQCWQEHTEILGLPVPPCASLGECVHMVFMSEKLQSQVSMHKHAWGYQHKSVAWAYETRTRTRIISENQEMKMEWKSLIFGSKKLKSLNDKLWPPHGGPRLWHDIKTGRQCITTVKTLGWKKPTPNVRLYMNKRLYKHLDVEDGAGFRWRASPSESDIHLETSCQVMSPGLEGWSHVVETPCTGHGS